MSPSSDLKTVFEIFIQTTTLEEAYDILKKYPQLLTDESDIFFSRLIHEARQQGRHEVVMVLDERRNFIRSVRQELEEAKDKMPNESLRREE